MKLRKAVISDLPQLKSVFTEIIAEMKRNNVDIWNDYYPCELFEDDIKNDELYVLADGDIIVSACVLCGTNEAEEYIEWADKNAKVFYIDRFGVNIDYQHKGIAGKMLRFAMDIAKEADAEYLRLFVVDKNFPAIKLYEKSGFKRMNGVFYEEIREDLVYTEFGYEIKVK